ncbi:unnamed protein product [Staurois parvus]|uniref:Secreted protein n=1 Tax=Staurois parvus TaxID=386267 RepID=A0ABN9FYQ6_9NEOB|nr:unnamed protein product [Staurois parvus]
MYGYTLHMLSFFSLESACDQHRANPHCSDRGQAFCILLEQKENSTLLQALTSAQLNTEGSHKTAPTADEKRYLAVYIY